MSLQVAFPSLEKPGDPYDAIVVGAGPAGLAAAIYLARANLKTLVLEAEKLGGNLNTIWLIENYPGFPSISGPELAQRMVKHAQSAGVTLSSPARVIGFELHEEAKLLLTRESEYRATNVLLTMGVQRRKSRIPGATKLSGKGVSYCAVCDGSFFKGKPVALIGNDEETIAEGFYLAGLTGKISLISGAEIPKFGQQSLDKLLSKENVEHFAGYELTEIIGESAVEKISLRSADGKVAELDVQGVFIAGEKTPVGAILAATDLKTDSSGCIEVDSEMRTNLPGVYAAGDITCGRKFQIAVSVGHGVTAALSIIKSQAGARRKLKS